jgi:hypothetical protein
MTAKMDSLAHAIEQLGAVEVKLGRYVFEGASGAWWLFSDVDRDPQTLAVTARNPVAVTADWWTPKRRFAVLQKRTVAFIASSVESARHFLHRVAPADCHIVTVDLTTGEEIQCE